jgi:hypothetical protein
MRKRAAFGLHLFSVFVSSDLASISVFSSSVVDTYIAYSFVYCLFNDIVNIMDKSVD